MNNSIWDQILSRIETKINRHSFYTWFKQTVFVSDAKDTVNVRVPNSLFREWLTKHYSGVVTEALKEVDRGEASVVFTVGDDGQDNIEQNALVEPHEEASRATPKARSLVDLMRDTLSTLLLLALLISSLMPLVELLPKPRRVHITRYLFMVVWV